MPELAKQAREDDATGPASGPETAAQEAELFARALERTKPQKPLDMEAALMGRDADFSELVSICDSIRESDPGWLTYGRCINWLPLNSGDAFLSAQQETISCLVWYRRPMMRCASTARCVNETSEVQVSGLSSRKIGHDCHERPIRLFLFIRPSQRMDQWAIPVRIVRGRKILGLYARSMMRYRFVPSYLAMSASHFQDSE